MWSGVELSPSPSPFMPSGSWIGFGGGSVISQNQKATVTIPRGALATSTMITIDETTQRSVGLNNGYRFGPEGQHFDLPVTIAINYDAESLPANVRASDLRLGKFVNGKWQEVPGSFVVTSANTVRGTVSDFSIYGIIVVDKRVLPAPFNVTAQAGDGKVMLSWSLVPDATDYRVYMSTSTLITTSQYDMKHENRESSFTHSGLINGTTYYFLVTAVNASGIEGHPSQTISATPIAPVIPTVTLSVGKTSINEMGGTTTITAILSTVTTLDVTVTLTINSTSSASPTDYTISTTTLTISGGIGSGSVTLTAIEDNLNETNETVVIELGHLVNGTIGTSSQQTVTILNDNGLIVRDPAFGQGGKVSTVISAYSNKAYALIDQSDGKLVVAGSCAVSQNSPADFCLARYHTNGTLDAAFGHGGKVTTPISNVRDVAKALVVQPDGKLIAAGHCYHAGEDDFCLARYHTNGTLDTTFGNGGNVITSVGTNKDIANAMVLQTDGKIVLAGYCYMGNNDFCLARYNANGSLDTTFDHDGKVTTPIGSADDQVNALILQSDGKLIAAGMCQSGAYDFCLARYNNDGSLDITFGNAGKVITSMSTNHDQINALVLQSDGKLIAAGMCQIGTYDFCLARYNMDGSLDTTFDHDGKVTTPIGSADDQINAIVLQSDGKLIAAGICVVSNVDFCLTRYNMDGGLDITFGFGGTILTDFSAGSDIARAMILQPDGKLVAAGDCHIEGIESFCLARFNPD